MFGMMKATFQVLGIKQLRILVYHPQTNRFIEHLNGTIKCMLPCCMQKDLKKWDLLLTPLLFALRDTPQASTQFAPFVLVYGHKPRGLLQMVREDWESSGNKGVGIHQHRQMMIDHLSMLGKLHGRIWK